MEERKCQTPDWMRGYNYFPHELTIQLWRAKCTFQTRSVRDELCPRNLDQVFEKSCTSKRQENRRHCPVIKPLNSGKTPQNQKSMVFKQGGLTDQCELVPKHIQVRLGLNGPWNTGSSIVTDQVEVGNHNLIKKWKLESKKSLRSPGSKGGFPKIPKSWALKRLRKWKVSDDASCEFGSLEPTRAFKVSPLAPPLNTSQFANEDFCLHKAFPAERSPPLDLNDVTKGLSERSSFNDDEIFESVDSLCQWPLTKWASGECVSKSMVGLIDENILDAF